MREEMTDRRRPARPFEPTRRSSVRSLLAVRPGCSYRIEPGGL
ncbi:hypothetical protein HSR122_0273 [Halapricum desulfuricans]|uniref:Uncharacterized protein n=1 Tax=Halapricum desulfuricans TaxID=2841257 RepID=A0A897N4M3_9EURY|nr:hypothetical protein HSR122_0273 [Halapricum desulfuricans]